jgi:hypothetical protein
MSLVLLYDSITSGPRAGRVSVITSGGHMLDLCCVFFSELEF